MVIVRDSISLEWLYVVKLVSLNFLINIYKYKMSYNKNYIKIYCGMKFFFLFFWLGILLSIEIV